jgi:phosphoglycolate phosphatase-like HAD superfamily hydrolase
MINAIIFDWDGTLVQSKKVIAASFIKVLNDLGLRKIQRFFYLFL